jgi:hypothetical protein
MPIADPPLAPHLLFESPWPIVAVLVVVAVGLGIAGTRRANGRLQLAGAALVVLACGAWLLAWAVTTDREAVMARTEQLVQATAPLAMGEVRRLVAEDAIITGPNGEVWYDWSVAQDQLQRTLTTWPVTDQTIRGLAVEVQGDAARSALDLRTTLEAAGLPMPSTWLLTWRRTSDGGWQATEIRWLTLQGEEPRKGRWR